MSTVGECRRIVDMDRRKVDRFISISEMPKKLVESNSVSLWGQSVQGEKTVDLMSQDITTLLSRLAESGTNGRTTEHEGVKYKFIDHEYEELFLYRASGYMSAAQKEAVGLK